MTDTTKKPRPKAKVFYDHGKCVKIGPLGFFRVGDVLTVRGQERIVCRIDLDGMAQAWTRDVVEMYDESGKPRRSVQDGIQVLSGGQQAKASGIPVSWLNARQVQQCRNIAAVGERLREEHEKARAA